MQQRNVNVTEHQLVYSHRYERKPRYPKGRDQRKGHGMTGIGQILGQRRSVLFVVNGLARLELTNHHEYVAEIVDDRDDAGAQHEYGQRSTVGGHVAPVQFANVRFRIENGIAVAEQRWTAQQCRRDPREGHPALTSIYRRAEIGGHLNSDIFIVLATLY